MTTGSSDKCTLLDVLTPWQAHAAVCKQLLVYKQAVCGVCARILTRLKTAAQLCNMFSVCYVTLPNSHKHDAGTYEQITVCTGSHDSVFTQENFSRPFELAHGFVLN